MLTHLQISHYALIENLDIDIKEGYTVITGETGAGKSILLGALNLLLGARADSRVVKQGEQKCVVEATFHINDSAAIRSFFEENDMEYDAEECVIRRELTAAGKSRAFVNDSPVLLSVLKPLGSQLVDIHSQHQNQLLGSEEFLLQTLDLVALNEKQRAEYHEAYEQYNAACKALNELQHRAAQSTQQLELMRFQLQQLEEFNPQEGEQEELEEEQRLLAHAEDIKSGLYQAIGALDSESASVVQQLRAASQSLNGISGHLSAAEELTERIESTRIEISDIISELSNLEENVEFNPQRLQYVDDRLAALYQLKKRHGVETDAELLKVMADLRAKVDGIDNIDEEIMRLTKAEADAHAHMLKCGAALTKSREKVAETMANSLKEQIAFLGMPHGEVCFALSTRTEPQADGMDNLMLMFSANKNVPTQNVQDIASGGEVARLMLSLKAYTARYRQLPTIIFDEIDTGVSGTMAERMGQVMKELSQNCQVLCITHLPQIAALGDSHLRVYKEEDDDGTHSHLTHLTSDERVREIANMLTGAEMTDAALNNAKSLLGIS